MVSFWEQLTSVMGSAGLGWSGLRGRLVGDVAAAAVCTPGPKPERTPGRPEQLFFN